MRDKFIADKKCNSRTGKGLTMLEMIISLSIIAVLFAVMLPQFRNIENSWASKQANAETLQNGRILIDYLNRNLAKATQVTAVSDPCDTTGYIEFEANDSTTCRFDISASNYVRFGPLGNLSEIGGPVSQMQFTCYSAEDLDTPITTVGDIRSVRVEITVTNGGSGYDQTFTTQVYLRTNASAASGLVAHWKFDEGSGTVAGDSGPNGYDGTIDGATWISGDSCPWLGGAARSGLNFDGDNDFVDIDTEIPGLLEEATIALWLKLYCEGVWSVGSSIISNDSWGLVGDAHINVYMEGLEYADLDVSIADEVEWAVYEIWTDVADPCSLWSGFWDGRWYHVAIVLDSDRGGEPYGEIWIDGQLLQEPDAWQEPTKTYPGVVFGNATIGAWNENGTILQDFLPGAICDMRIYSQCLNQQQIAELAGTRAGLVGYWKFDETSGSVAYDWSGNNYDAFVDGGTWEPAGQIDGALNFDGTDDYVDTTISSDSMIEVTFCMWFKSDDAGSIGDDEVAQRFITQLGSSSRSRFALGINNNKVAVY